MALAADEAKLVSLPVKVPVNVERALLGDHGDAARTAATTARDRLRTAQKVIEVHPVRVYQATLVQLDERLQMPVERPAGAVPGRGGMRVELMGSLAGELSGGARVFRALSLHLPRAAGLEGDRPQR